MEKTVSQGRKVLKVSGPISARDRRLLLGELSGCGSGSSVRIDLSGATRISSGFSRLLSEIERRSPRPDYHVSLSEKQEFFVDVNI